MIRSLILYIVLTSAITASEEQSEAGQPTKEQQRLFSSASRMNGNYTLGDFNKQFFWQKPPEGIFDVDIGLNEAKV